MVRDVQEVRLLARWIGRFQTALSRREEEDLPGETEQEFLAECAALGISRERAVRLLVEGWELGQQRIDLEELDVWSDGAWGADDPFAERDATTFPAGKRGGLFRSPRRTPIDMSQPGEEKVERLYGRSIWTHRRAA